MRMFMKGQLFRDTKDQTPGPLFEVYRCEDPNLMFVKLISNLCGDVIEEQIVHTSCLSDWLESREDY